MSPAKHRLTTPIPLEAASGVHLENGGHPKTPKRYADRVEQYAEARRRNRRSACREAGKELKNRVEVIKKRGGEPGEVLRKSA